MLFIRLFTAAVNESTASASVAMSCVAEAIKEDQKGHEGRKIGFKIHEGYTENKKCIDQLGGYNPSFIIGYPMCATVD